MSNNQCRTCALPSNARIELENSWATGASYPFLSEQAAKMGFELPPRTLNNHFIAGHSSVDRTLAPKPTDVPKEDTGPTASATMTHSGGEITTGAKKLTGDGPIDFDSILVEFGFDPKKYAVSPTGVRTSRWQSANGEWLVSYRIQVVLRETVSTLDDFEFDSMRRQAFDSVRARVKTSPEKKDRRRQVVVVPADRQVGKVGKRGGTPELLERVEAQRERLIPYLQEQAPERVVYGDVGDIVEGFNNVASQKFLNDLSLMGQLETAGSIIEGDIQAIHSVVPDITALTVPSNHSAWRDGKDYLGKPEDDWGIFLFKQTQKMLGYNPEYSSVDFVHPDPWEISTSTEVFEYKLGFTHGDKCNIDKTGDWWAKQNAGNSPLSGVHILNTGHYHTPRTQIIGTTAKNLPVWWLLAPTSDNGSDWWRHMAGHDSDPGLLVYTVYEDTGFDFGSMRIL